MFPHRKVYCWLSITLFSLTLPLPFCLSCKHTKHNTYTRTWHKTRQTDGRTERKFFPALCISIRQRTWWEVTTKYETFLHKLGTNSIRCFTDSDKLNLVKFIDGGLVLGSIQYFQYCFSCLEKKRVALKVVNIDSIIIMNFVLTWFRFSLLRFVVNRKQICVYTML